MTKKLQIIDWECKGNLIKLYLGKNGEQWGDDWDDAPYDCNAGEVYNRYVEKVKYFYIPWKYWVFEPDNFLDVYIAKEDLIKRRFPILEIRDADWGGNFIANIHMGDTLEQLPEIFKECVYD